MFGRKRRNPKDFSDELRAHITLEMDRLRDEGFNEQDAYQMACRRLGGTMKYEERFYESNHLMLFDHLKQDIRYALRQIRKSPGFALTAILTLALGIGGTTAMFSLIHAVLLKSLPVAKPDQLYRVGENNATYVGVFRGLQTSYSLFSSDMYKYFRDNNSSIDGFEELAAFQSVVRRISARRVSTTEPALAVFSQFVSGNYFKMFGVGAFAGRVLRPDDDRADSPPVVVISYSLWQQKYGLDPAVIGTVVNINSNPATIVGVAPPDFFGETLRSTPPDFWMPLSFEPVTNPVAPLSNNPDLDWLYIIGRLRPGANPATIEAGLKVQLQQWLRTRASAFSAAERAQLPQQTLKLVPAGAGIETMRVTYESGLRLLMILSTFVLLIVCANIANLSLVRGLERKQQISISVALGAPRSRLIVQALTESLLLAVIGGALGLGVAFAGIRMILSLVFPTASYIPISASPSITVLLFATAVSLVSGTLFGISPAWLTSRVDPMDVLRGGTRSSTDVGSILRKALVVAQAALSLSMVAGAGLMAQSLRNLESQKMGFQTDRRIVIRIDPKLAGYKPNQLDQLYPAIKQRLTEIPGVLSSSYSIFTPMSGSLLTTSAFIQGKEPPPPNSDENTSWWNRVGPDYFDAVGTRIIQGRPVTEQDTASSVHVAVVNETFARRFFGNEDPIGKHFGKAEQKTSGDFVVVGVVEDTKYRNPRDAAPPMFFLPATQTSTYDSRAVNEFESNSRFANDIVVRVAPGMQGMETQIRGAFEKVDPNLVIIRVLNFSDQVYLNFNQEVLIFRLTLIFGIVALVLASIGLYGVTSYTVQRRTKEIGIRMALGADRSNVLGVILRGVLVLTGIGLLLGIPLSVLIGRFLSAQLFGVGSYNLPVLAGAVVVLSLFAFCAVIVPARRAASIDPLSALRAD